MKIPKRGDIFQIDLTPTQGSEQQGNRPVLVVSDKEFNQGGNYARLQAVLED